MTALLQRSTEIRRGSVTAKPILPSLWRVVGPDGAVRGHINTVAARDGERFAAKLILAGGIRTMFLGEFWQLEDALDCFG